METGSTRSCPRIVALALLVIGAGCMPSRPEIPIDHKPFESLFDPDRPDIFYDGYESDRVRKDWLRRQKLSPEFTWARLASPSYYNAERTKLRFYGSPAKSAGSDEKQGKIAVFHMGREIKVIDTPSPDAFLNDKDEIVAWRTKPPGSWIRFSGGIKIAADGFIMDSDARYFVNGHTLYAVGQPHKALARTNPFVDHSFGSFSPWTTARLFCHEDKVWLFGKFPEKIGILNCETFSRTGDAWKKTGEHRIKCPPPSLYIFRMRDFHPETQRLLLLNVLSDWWWEDVGYVHDLRSGRFEKLVTSASAIFLDPSFFSQRG